MKYKKIYEITFCTKQNRAWYKHMIHIEAWNLGEAKQIAKDLWYEAYKPHMFNLTARVVKDGERINMAHWFVEA